METLSKPKQIFLYVAPFPALAFFKFWASSVRDTGSLLAVSCILLAYCVLILFIA